MTVLVGVVAAFVSVTAITPSSATAAWHYVENCTGVTLNVACYEWQDDGDGGPVGEQISVQQFKSMAARAAQAVEDLPTGATQEIQESITGIRQYPDGGWTAAQERSEWLEKVFKDAEDRRLEEMIERGEAIKPEDAAGDGADAEGDLVAEAIDSGVIDASTLSGAASVAAPAVGAAVVGYEIGKAIIGIFGGGSEPPSREARVVGVMGWRIVPGGESIASISNGNGTKVAYAPGTGLVAELGEAHGASTQAQWDWYEGCTGVFERWNTEWPQPLLGETGFEPIRTGPLPEVGQAGEDGCVWHGEGFWKPLAVAGILSAGGAAAANLPVAGQLPEAQSLPPVAAMQEGAEADLQNPAYDALNKREAESAGFDEGEPISEGANAKVPVPKPGAHEQYTEYDQALEEAGLEFENVAEPEAGIDPRRGPLEVVSVSPTSGTKVEPGAKVKVRYNPTSAPEPAEETENSEGEPGSESEGWSPPAIPSIDLTPITGIHIGCNTFPFGAFCWYGEALTSWGSEGSCPSFAVPIGHGTKTDPEGELGVDTCEWEPAMNIVRPIIVLLGTLGVGLFFAYAAMGLGGGSGED